VPGAVSGVALEQGRDRVGEEREKHQVGLCQVQRALYRALGGDGVAELVARDRLEQGRRHHPYRMDSDGAIQDGRQRGCRPQRVVLDQP
jgi:hypothetical protein